MESKVLINENFRDDTQKLGQFTEDFIKEFYPCYSMNNKLATDLPKEDSLILLNTFTFYRLCECKIYNVEDRFAYFSEKMKKLFIMAYSIKQEVCYGIVSNDGKTSLLLGVAPTSDDETIKCILEGILPGVKLERYNQGFINTTMDIGNGCIKDKSRYVGCVCGVPTLKVDGKYQNKDLSTLMRSLNGQNYTIMVLCKPVDEDYIQEKIRQAINIQDECFAISKRNLSIQRSNSKGNSNINSYTETKTVGTSESNGYSVTTGIFNGNIAGIGLKGLINQSFSINKSSTNSSSTSNSQGYSNAVTDTISHNESISADVQNSFAIELMNMAKSMIERLKIGRNIGMWESVVTYSSDSKIANDIIQGSLYSEIASNTSNALPPVVFSYEDTYLNHSSNTTHNQQLMIPKNFFDGKYDNTLCSLVTSEEICGICTIPIDATIGFEIKESKNYSLNYISKTEDNILGTICEYDRPLPNITFGLSEQDLNKHIFVCGITGSGKTNTIKRILETVNKPFLVIEPAKKEYRNLKKEIDVYTLGRPEINCIKINPFYILPGISPQQHIDLLKDLFSASFAFYGPMPYILEKCLNNIYAKKGWNLILGFHPLLVNIKSKEDLFNETKIQELYCTKSHKYLFPSMQDLKDEIDYYIENEMTYEGEVKGNIRGAIRARINSLCVGSKGYMLNTYDIIDFDSLLKRGSVLELEGLADDADKAFMLGLLIIYVNEYRQIKQEVSRTNSLKHLLVIEEAHRLLKNVAIENNEDLGNPKGKAVEHFTNMLSEMRSYGQSVIIAEQIPSKIALDVIKNSSTKIIHRIVAKDDQEIIANTVGIYSQDAISLGNSKVGYALCHKEGMIQPVIVKINEVSSNRILDVYLYNKDIDKKLFDINKSIIKNQLPNEIFIWSIKTLVSLLYNPNSKDIYSGLECAYDEIYHKIYISAITLIPNINRKDCILDCIIESIISLMISGVFSIHNIPGDDFVELLTNTILVPTESKLNDLQVIFEKYYSKKPASKAIEIIAELFSEEYYKGYDITNFVEDFSLLKNSKFSDDVKMFLREKAE